MIAVNVLAYLKGSTQNKVFTMNLSRTKLIPVSLSLLVMALFMLSSVPTTYAAPSGARETPDLESNRREPEGTRSIIDNMGETLGAHPDQVPMADTSFGGDVAHGENGQIDDNVPIVNPGATWPVITGPMNGKTNARVNAFLGELFRTTGANDPKLATLPVSTNSMASIVGTAAIMGSNLNHTPEQAMARAQEEQNQANQTSADTNAQMERNQAGSAIDFVAHYLYNFTTEANNKWNRVRNELFLPMALLLLLPGVVLAQLKATVAAGTPVIADVTSPFDGILRAIVGIFLIPATYLVINYGIDVSNSITYTIQSEYKRIFGTDMYKDAMCAHIRAFPARNPSENLGYVKNEEAKMGRLGPNNTPFSEFEGKNLEVALRDPCANLDNVPKDRANEQVSDVVNAQRNSYNTMNSALAMTWNILCAFQMAYLYYLWFVGPVIAALWVYPMKELRDAFPSWINGVCTICFWSLFWNTTILLMACCRGVDETGTLIMSALNFLSTACVKFAFDFAGLVKEAGMQAAKMAEKGGAAGGGAGGAKGAQGSQGASGSNGQGSQGAPGGTPSQVPGGQPVTVGASNNYNYNGGSGSERLAGGAGSDLLTGTPGSDSRSLFGQLTSSNTRGFENLGFQPDTLPPGSANDANAALGNQLNLGASQGSGGAGSAPLLGINLAADGGGGGPLPDGGGQGPIPGDSNGDGKVDLDDIKVSFGLEDGAPASAAGLMATGISATDAGGVAYAARQGDTLNQGGDTQNNQAFSFQNPDQLKALFADRPEAAALRAQIHDQLQARMAEAAQAGMPLSVGLPGGGADGGGSSIAAGQFLSALNNNDVGPPGSGITAGGYQMLSAGGADYAMASLNGASVGPIDLASIPMPTLPSNLLLQASGNGLNVNALIDPITGQPGSGGPPTTADPSYARASNDFSLPVNQFSAATGLTGPPLDSGANPALAAAAANNPANVELLRQQQSALLADVASSVTATGASTTSSIDVNGIAASAVNSSSAFASAAANNITGTAGAPTPDQIAAYNNAQAQQAQLAQAQTGQGTQGVQGFQAADLGLPSASTAGVNMQSIMSTDLQGLVKQREEQQVAQEAAQFRQQLQGAVDSNMTVARASGEAALTGNVSSLPASSDAIASAAAAGAANFNAGYNAPAPQTFAQADISQANGVGAVGSGPGPQLNQEAIDLQRQNLAPMMDTLAKSLPDAPVSGQRSIDAFNTGGGTGSGAGYTAGDSMLAANSAGSAGVVQGSVGQGQVMPQPQPGSDIPLPIQTASASGTASTGSGGGFFANAPSADANATAGGLPANYISQQVGNQWKDYDNRVVEAQRQEYAQMNASTVENSLAKGTLENSVTGMVPGSAGAAQQAAANYNTADAAPAFAQASYTQPTYSQPSYTEASYTQTASPSYSDGGAGGFARESVDGVSGAMSPQNDVARESMDQLAQALDYTPEVRMPSQGGGGGSETIIPGQGLQYYAQQGYQSSDPSMLQNSQLASGPLQNQLPTNQLPTGSTPGNPMPQQPLANPNPQFAQQALPQGTPQQPQMIVPIPLPMRYGSVASSRSEAVNKAIRGNMSKDPIADKKGNGNGNKLSSALGRAASKVPDKKGAMPGPAPRTVKDPMGSVATGSTLRRLRQKRKWSADEIEAMKRLAASSENSEKNSENTDWDV